MNDAQRAKWQAEQGDVTTVFNHYRVSARAIWNTAFWPDPDFRDWDSVDQFDAIQRILFDELVLAKLGREWPLDQIFRVPIPFFGIVPSSREVPIMIQNPRPGSGSGYWDYPLKSIKREEADLLFIEYFDWNRMDYVDFRYYRVQIGSFDGHPELVGREALIEWQYALAYVREKD